MDQSDHLVRSALADLRTWRERQGGGRDEALFVWHELLFEPLMPRLRGIKGLYLIPHGFLHTIPLHACAAEERVCLSDVFDLSYLPSASLLPRLPPLAITPRVTSYCNPESHTPWTLPFSEWEADELARRLDSREHLVYRGSSASRDTVAALGRSSR